MNERVKAIADKIWSLDTEPNPHFNLCLQEFAELIVRECIANCDDLNSMKYIANHFGIKIEGLE